MALFTQKNPIPAELFQDVLNSLTVKSERAYPCSPYREVYYRDRVFAPALGVEICSWNYGGKAWVRGVETWTVRRHELGNVGAAHRLIQLVLKDAGYSRMSRKDSRRLMDVLIKRVAEAQFKVR
jgi:hypothetical protein